MDRDSIINSIIDSIHAIHIHYETTTGTNSSSEIDAETGFILFFVFLLPLWFVLAFLGYHRWKNRKWMRGVFPADLAYSKTNLMKAYVSLTVCFITFDRNHQMRKIAYLRSFFLRNFKQIPEKYDELVDRNFHYPIEPISIVNWINQHSGEQQKKQLVQFLAGLCHIDKVLRKKEYDALRVITRTLQLDLSFLESTISSYRHNNKKENKKSERTSNHRVNATPPGISKRKKYADVLGVNENAGTDEIKKRHRQLVKLYHPDKYARESNEKQKQAHQRFLEIQEAYEFLVASK